MPKPVPDPMTPTHPPEAAEAEVQALILRVGARVRQAREIKGIPRRVLSERSGVSPRYLAQLEAGEGNISIGLLQKVAAALGTPIEWLVGQDDPWVSDMARLVDLYRAASPTTRRAVLAQLAPDQSGPRRGRRICLVGLRGAGKSTLGRRAGAALGIPFVELNAEIEAAAGMPVAEVMALYGQEGYRDLEAQALKDVAARDEPLVLAVAGGIVGAPETFARLLDSFHTVWLRARPEEHMTRVLAQGDTRPMAGNPEAMDQLRAILAARESAYSRASAQLDTSGTSPEAALANLLALIETRKFLKDADETPWG